MAEAQSPMFAKFGKHFTTGTVLFREGDRGEEMFILQSGKVKISKKIRGVEKTLATLEKGEFFGEMAILNDKPRSASAETIEDCDMLGIGHGCSLAVGTARGTCALSHGVCCVTLVQCKAVLQMR